MQGEVRHRQQARELNAASCRRETSPSTYALEKVEQILASLLPDLLRVEYGMGSHGRGRLSMQPRRGDDEPR